MATFYDYENRTALDPYTGAGAPNAVGQVFAKTDTTFSTPLTVVLMGSGLQATDMTTDQYSQLPGFQVDGHLQVVFKSGDFTKVLNTTTPLVGPQGAAVAEAVDNGDNTVTFLLEDGTPAATVTLPASDVPGPEGPKGDKGDTGLPGPDAIPADEAVATYATTPGTATATALSATIAGDVPVRYVAANGDDNKKGRFWGEAKKTIQSAVDSFTATGRGVVYVGPGVYPPFSTNRTNLTIIGMGATGQNAATGYGQTVIDCSTAPIDLATGASEMFQGANLQNLNIIGNDTSTLGMRVGKMSNFIFSNLTFSNFKNGTALQIVGGIASQYGTLYSCNFHDAMTGLEVLDHNGLRVFGGTYEFKNGSFYTAGSRAIVIGGSADTARVIGAVTQFYDTCYEVSGSFATIEAPRMEAFKTGVRFTGLGGTLGTGASLNNNIIGAGGTGVEVTSTANRTHIHPYQYGSLTDPVINAGTATYRGDSRPVDFMFSTAISATASYPVYNIPKFNGPSPIYKVGYCELRIGATGLVADAANYWTVSLERRGGGTNTLGTISSQGGWTSYSGQSIPNGPNPTVTEGDSLRLVFTKVGSPPNLSGMSVNLLLTPA